MLDYYIKSEDLQNKRGKYIPRGVSNRNLNIAHHATGATIIDVDEIQTGFGRTGKLFAMDHFDVIPDLVTVSKSLAAGLPLSGVVGRSEILDATNPGELGGTYAGNPVACAAALAVIDISKRRS